MVQNIIIKVLKFSYMIILMTIGMIIMITGKGGNDCEVTRIKYFIININYFYIMGVYVCRLIK